MNNPAPGSRNFVVVAAIAAVLIVVVGLGWAIQANRDTTGDAGKTPGQSGAPGEVAETAPIAPIDTYGLGVGETDAKAKVEIFEDFRCPHCKDFEELSSEPLRALAREGKALIVYRPMAFLNEYSVKAMNAFGAAIDAGDGAAALALHDVLFAEQPSGDSVPADDWFVEQAEAVGIESADVEGAITGLEFQQWVVNGTDDSSKRGVTGTPAVFVNGKQVEADTIQQMLDRTLAAVAAAQ